MKTCDFSDAKVGDKVWNFVNGWGKVITMSKSGSYPIKVEFENNICKTFNLNGFLAANHFYPTLFWNGFEIPEAAYEKPLPNLEVDTKVVVWDDEETEKYNRYFSHFNKEGNIEVFYAGATSWSVENTCKTYAWDNWELVDETKAQ